MSELERRVEPLLLPLALGSREVYKLSQSEADFLSFWTAKTAYAALDANAADIECPLEHSREVFHMQAAPEDVYVIASQVGQDGSCASMSTRAWRLYEIRPSDEGSPHLELVKTTSYKVALQVGRLLLMVAYLPVKEWYLALNPDYHHVLTGKANRVRWMKAEVNEHKPVDALGLLGFFTGELFGMTQDFGRLVESSGRVWNQIALVQH